MRRIQLTAIMLAATLLSPTAHGLGPGFDGEAYLALKERQLEHKREVLLAAQDGEVLAFDATWSAQIVALQMAGPFASVNIRGQGTAMVIGDFTLEFPHLVLLPAFVERGEMTVSLSDGSGDVLMLKVTGVSYPVGPGLVRAIPMGDIVGGTGKFEKAAGTLLFDSLVNLMSGEVHGNWMGFITGVTAPPAAEE